MTEPSPPIDIRLVRAEAASWLSRLHSDDRTKMDEAAFRLWLEKNEEHANAFAQITAAWDLAGGLKQGRFAADGQVSGHSRRSFVAASISAGVMVAGLGAWLLNRPDMYRTAIGEQRRVTLADGSTIFLDTRSSVRVALGPQRREIELIEGRAHFAVAKDPLKPFVVKAGDQQVVALGTAFDVGRYDNEVEIILAEGSVAVRKNAAVADDADTILAPGDRLLFRRSQLVLRDRPDMQNMAAWQSGRLVFSHDLFMDAARSFNRYNARQLVIADPALAQMQISGVYDAGNPEGFARSAAALLPISIENDGHRIILRLAARTS